MKDHSGVPICGYRRAGHSLRWENVVALPKTPLLWNRLSFGDEEKITHAMGSLDNWTMCGGCLLVCFCSLVPRIWGMRLCEVMADPTNKNYITTCSECCVRWTRPVSTLHLSLVPGGPHWRLLESLICNVFGSFFPLQNT